MGTTKEFVASNPGAPMGLPGGPDEVRKQIGVMPKEVGQNGLPQGNLTLLATAIGQIGEAVVITDTAATIEYVNPAFTRITGYSAEEGVLSARVRDLS
jgi:PAS domain-containing protein